MGIRDTPGEWSIRVRLKGDAQTTTTTWTPGDEAQAWRALRELAVVLGIEVADFETWAAAKEAVAGLASMWDHGHSDPAQAIEAKWSGLAHAIDRVARLDPL